MSQLEKKYLLELDKALNYLNANSNSYDLLEVLIAWLSSNDDLILRFKKLGYDFTKYMNMKADNYPIDKSLLYGEEIVYFKNNIRRKLLLSNFKLQYVVQYIRDTLERLFIEHVERVCPSCGWEEMQKLEEQDTHLKVYQCIQCGAAFYDSGARYTQKNNLHIPTRKM